MSDLVSDKILAILPTRRCTAACNHCGSFSHPEAKDKLSSRVVLNAIKQAAELNFGLISFTGGEATLEWETLSRAVQYARKHGLLTRLVTNAHWAKTRIQAQKVIHTFRRWGLNQLNLSSGDEHIRFVPLEFVINCLVEGVLGGYDLQLMVEYKADRATTKDAILSHPALASLTSSQLSKIEIIESPWMPLSHKRYFSYGIGQTISQDNVSIREGCKSVLQSYTVEPDGRVSACCGLGIKLIPELAVGEVSESNFLRKAIDKAENDFLKIWLRYEGPEKILAWASEKNKNILWEGQYAHNCQACHRIYKDPAVHMVIKNHYKEVVANVATSAIIDEKLYTARLSKNKR